MIQVSDAELREAAGKGMDEFIALFVDKYWAEMGGELTAEGMAKLNAYQNTLLAYSIFRNEMNDGGFVQLIQNGYGGYFFQNPFAKSMRLFGARQLAKLVYDARTIYMDNREELERETTEEEFLAMYVDFEVFDELEEKFFLIEEETTEAIAHYVDENLSLFAEVV